MEISNQLRLLWALYPLCKRLCGPHRRSGHFGAEKSLLSLPGTQPRPSSPFLCPPSYLGSETNRKVLTFYKNLYMCIRMEWPHEAILSVKRKEGEFCPVCFHRVLYRARRESLTCDSITLRRVPAEWRNGRSLTPAQTRLQVTFLQWSTAATARENVRRCVSYAVR
jgi:DNA-directed RNA polymerase subunit RPC12/RpoP